MWQDKRPIGIRDRGQIRACVRMPGPLQALCQIATLAVVMALVPLPGRAEVQIGGPFELTDQNGNTRNDQDFRGSYLLIYFGFTNCADTCPTALSTMTQGLEALAMRDPAKAEQVVPIFVSVDPERDTPEVLREYAGHFHPRLVALTGTPRQLDAVARPYGVFFAKVPTGGPARYVIDHTSFIYLIGPDGRYIEHFESEADADQIDAALMRSVHVPEVSGDN